MDLLKQFRRRQTRWWDLVVLWAALAQMAPLLSPQSSGEYEVKAAFLYKFASFVEWPEATRDEPLGICVVGKDPFGGALERVVEGKTIGGREFVVRRLKAWQAGEPCHILFVAASEKQRLRPLLGQMRHEAILTVGDVPGFCEIGGAINLSVVESRVKLEINLDATARSGLQVSSKLLSLARIVRSTASAASAANGVRN
ncbi:MAG: YfiR family protein [Candidatus Solibacter sp.]|nr:YfiR family protein [Candidatus Solibacter sp.]